MEEVAYDDINDYYAYLPYFFDTPWRSLQYVAMGNGTLHQYGSVIFPIYLAERFEPDLVRAIWEKCRDLGVGPQFHTAVDQVIDSATAGEYNLKRLYNEFALWNVFTGTRRPQAPVGMGYSEGLDYPRFVDSLFLTFNEYTDSLIWFQPGGWSSDTLKDGTDISYFEANMPQILSAHYFDLRQISQVADDSLYVYFLGNRDTLYHTTWAISFIGFPVSGTGPATILGSYKPGELEPVRFNAPTDTYGHIVGVISPINTNIEAYPKKYGYTLIFNDSIAPPDLDFVTDFRAYPNPMRVDSPDDSITFRVSIETAERLTSPATLKVTIFNLAGEKVMELPDVVGTSGDYISNLFSGWHLENQSGKKVSGGVYLALVEIDFGDAHSPLQKKMKVALIK